MVGEESNILLKPVNGIREAVLYLLKLPSIFIVYKSTSSFTDLQFKARGSVYKLMGAIQGNGRKTWAHVHIGNDKFATTFGTVCSSNEKEVNNKPINGETKYLIYVANDKYDVQDDLEAVEALKRSLAHKIDKYIIPQFQAASHERDEAASRMRSLYTDFKLDYLDTPSDFPADLQMDRLMQIQNVMMRLYHENLFMWSQPAQYRNTHPDVPTVFFNHDGNCFLSTATSLFVHALPSSIRDSSLTSSIDERLKEALGSLIDKSGQAVEDLHALREAMGDRFKWIRLGAPISVIKHFGQMMPALRAQSVVWDWRRRSLDRSVQQMLTRYEEVSLVFDLESQTGTSIQIKNSDLSAQPVKVVFIQVNGVGSSFVENQTFTSHFPRAATYDLAAVINAESHTEHVTISFKTHSRKWFHFDNHFAWQIIPPTPFPWKEYFKDAAPQSEPLPNANAQLLMYVLRDDAPREASADHS